MRNIFKLLYKRGVWYESSKQCIHVYNIPAAIRILRQIYVYECELFKLEQDLGQIDQNQLNEHSGSIYWTADFNQIGPGSNLTKNHIVDIRLYECVESVILKVISLDVNAKRRLIRPTYDLFNGMYF